MKKLFSLLVLFAFFLAFLCFNPKVSAQSSYDKWFCQSLKMNAVLTGSGGTTARNISTLNTNGAGIYGTDTTIFIAVPDQHKNSWWSVYCGNTLLGTGGTGNHAFFVLKASMDGINTFDIPGDTTSYKLQNGSIFKDYKKWSTANTDYYKFALSAKTPYNYLFGPFDGFPYPYAAIYISKGVDSTTISARIYFSPPKR